MRRFCDGKEAARSNVVLGNITRAALVDVGLPEDAVVVVPAGDRGEIKTLVRLSGMIDLVIPRGGYDPHLPHVLSVFPIIVSLSFTVDEHDELIR